MELIWTLLVGLVAGALAKQIMPGRDPGGIIVTMLLGVAGAFVAAYIRRALGWYSNVGDGPGIMIEEVIQKVKTADHAQQILGAEK